MSNYPIWWDTTITVYNKHMDPQTNVITWYKKCLNNCFWKNTAQRMTLGQVELESHSTTIRIPENTLYRDKYVWEDFPNDVMGNYFTLANDDIIVKGNVTEDIDEYTSGSRSSDFIKKYKNQGCVVITNVTINTGVGRGLPHYHIEGS